MKKTKPKLWSFIIRTSVLALFYVSSVEAASNCSVAKQEFRKLYLELQAKYLNYEGKNAVLDAKGKLKLVAHDPNKEYEGKLFETAIYQEYQNTLKKVGKLYQAAKFETGNEELKNSSPGLVEFLKAIDGKEDSAYVQKNKISDVIDDLYKASNSKFGKGDKKFALNENDKYLLKKLLTHAQDRICSVEAFEKTGKKTRLFDAPYLAQVRNAPLNRLIGVMKSANIKADSDFLVDEKTAINSAMAEHMNQLAAWMKKNAHCRKEISNPGFLQANVQSCNYNKFLDVISQENYSQIEAFLHYINGNEKLLDRGQALAETALDDLKLESFIDKTFNTMGTKVSCTKVSGANGQHRIFVRNLPYKNDQFDTSKISCKVKGKDLKPSECAQKIELVSDELGRGVEIRQKSKSGASVTFSVAENPDCTGSGDEAVSSTPLTIYTNDICLKKGKYLIPNREKTDCIEDPSLKDVKGEDKCRIPNTPGCPIPNTADLKIEEKCKVPKTPGCPTPESAVLTIKEDKCTVPNAPGCPDNGQNRTSTIIIPDKTDGKKPIQCEPGFIPSLGGAFCVEKMSAEKCEKKGDAMSPPQDLKVSEDFRECVPADILWFLKKPHDCTVMGEKMNPKQDLIPTFDGKKCVERKTDQLCAELSKKYTKAKKQTPYASADGRTCIEKKTLDNCKIEALADNADPKKDLVPNGDGSKCVEKQTTDSCKIRGEKEKPPITMIPTEDKSDCIEDKKTDKMCKEQAEKEKGSNKKDLITSEDGKSCIERKTIAICLADGKKLSPPKELTPSSDGRSCIEKSGEEACKIKNKEWMTKENDNVPGIKWRWDEKAKACVDLKPAKAGPKSEECDVDDDDCDNEDAVPALRPQGPVPGRFNPITIPTRQQGFLPGMK